MKVENTRVVYTLGLYRDDGKECGNYYNGSYNMGVI